METQPKNRQELLDIKAQLSAAETEYINARAAFDAVWPCPSPQTAQEYINVWKCEFLTELIQHLKRESACLNVTTQAVPTMDLTPVYESMAATNYQA